MAQMPIQTASGRAEPYAPPLVPARPPVSAGKAAPGAPKAAQAVDAGGISGGLLRPGSIDQVTFRQRLEAANRGGAVPRPNIGQSPLMVPQTSKVAAKSTAAIPTLTPAQLAALGLDVSGLEAATATLDATFVEPLSAEVPAPVATDPAREGEAATDADQVPAADAELATAPPPEDTAPEAMLARDPDAPDVSNPGAPIPGARLGADGVWEVWRLPSKDEREWFAGMNQKWRIVENPDSVKLFLGEDGKFGFDDFLDMINPLQHIPLVNLAYRALTGDQINGAAQMVGAVAMGPLAAISTVADLAFKSETGQGLAANGIAMMFGPSDDQQGDDAPADVADYATAAGGTQLADLSQIRRGSNR